MRASISTAGLARQAVNQERLTLWQAQQLLAGRTSGFRVDRYLMLELIGHGGMGRVYLARDTRLNRHGGAEDPVAGADEQPPGDRAVSARGAGRGEAPAREPGADLRLRRVARPVLPGDGVHRGARRSEALIGKEGRLPPAEAARLTRQVALGLDHAHRKGLIHRDVNPYNVMVTHDGTAKLADLGLAIDMAEEERVTREGATVGTFDYVAPEQARHSQAADIRSDIYSLGCSIYHMIAGQVPFPSPSLPEKLYSHQALEPTPLTELVPEVPPALAAVVAKMMRKQPADRYETPEQVVRALEPFLDGAAPTMLEARTTPAMQPPEQTESAVLPPESQTQTKVATDDGAVPGRPAEGPPEVDNGAGRPFGGVPGPGGPGARAAAVRLAQPGQAVVRRALGKTPSSATWVLPTLGPHSSARPGAVRINRRVSPGAETAWSSWGFRPRFWR